MHALAQTGLVAALSAALVTHALRGWRRDRSRIDLWLAFITLCWLALMGVNLLLNSGWLTTSGLLVTRWVYQLLILGVTAFLLTAVGSFSGALRRMTIVQLVLGVGIAAAPAGDPWRDAWFLANAVQSTGLLLLAHTIWLRADPRGWMVLLVAISGLSIMLTDLDQADGRIPVSVLHFFYIVALFVLRLALSHRPAAKTGPDALPAEQERSRLAQDLHDGVGSQLASIISALDMSTPQQRATAASLQHCLAELKLLVDGMQGDASVLSHLASLRYRLQPLLEAAGIEMRWQIADEAMLETVQGDAALQFLRVAQEALVNVVRHSGASHVMVTCCHVKAQQALMLEVDDNGVGMAPAMLTGQGGRPRQRGPGKGLAGMDRRAHRMGGWLAIESTCGQGTRVRLLVPMAALPTSTPALSGHHAG